MSVDERNELDILIVEDNPANMMLAGAVLRRAGHRISEARSAEEAIEWLGKAKPDVILMDVQLPGMDGLTLTRRIKADSELGGVAVVALTAHAMKEDQAKALDAGCAGYIAKPINTRTFAEEVDGLMRAYRIGRARADV